MTLESSKNTLTHEQATSLSIALSPLDHLRCQRNFRWIIKLLLPLNVSFFTVFFVEKRVVCVTVLDGMTGGEGRQRQRDY